MDIAIISVFRFLQILLVIGLSTKTRGAKCKRKIDVKPANSSHLKLHLADFKERYEEGCKEIIVSNLSAIVEAYSQEDKTFQLDIGDDDAFIPTDPCFAYTIYLTASVGNESHTENKQISQRFNYNLRTNDRYPYNKELKNQVIDQICLESKDRIRIPHPPTSIESCVFTKGVQDFLGERVTNETYSSGNVAFEIIDPASNANNSRNICVNTFIDQIEDCIVLKSTKEENNERNNKDLNFLEVNMEMCRRNSNSNNNNSNSNSNNNSNNLKRCYMLHGTEGIIL